MKLTKKILAMGLSACMALSVLAGCSDSAVSSGSSKAEQVSSEAVSSAQQSAAAEKTTIKIAALKGPTGLGMLKLMSDNDAKTAAENYEFTILSSPDEIVSKISKGEVDVAAVPTNLAATLYNKTDGKVQMAAVNTLGVLSLLTKGENISSIKDLKGKTIYASGQGSVPEYALNYILKQNGLEVGKDVKVEYKAEHAELAALILSGKAKIAVLPEPFVTQVTTKDKDVKVALNITDEWDKAAQGKSVLTMGCVIVSKNFVEQHKDAFDAFLSEYKDSTDFTNTKVEEAAALSEKYDIMPAAVAKKAIPNCNIVYIDGNDMKAKIPDFLNVLFTANQKSVGGKLPGDDFYYTK
ncbi:ABC transporter substrate-binding protein [Caproiciproducens faecalis]|uniref:ABC transporter substrate-binding protein n=1 Tax=Caproiciproducens faecalis TaxID=2820301 RepID=A0ABS7DS23_9FIRM|nr:PhnD/SsuA/transferrin family substrate-binding protein [Caproiciproducens faecalis]MBW7573944.1 ABC transporter substrate-binding protein [Caproiciproducens faecalis]